MITLNNEMLASLGLDALPADEKNRLLAHIYETLEMRVGMTLARRMSNEQLSEFERFIDAGDQQGALAWLEHNFPNYREVVAMKFSELQAEIKDSALAILAAAASEQLP